MNGGRGREEGGVGGRGDINAISGRRLQRSKQIRGQLFSLCFDFYGLAAARATTQKGRFLHIFFDSIFI